MAKPLTINSIEGIKPGAVRKEIPDGGLPGLYLIVQPSGAMTWAIRYRFGNKPRKMTVGALQFFKGDDDKISLKKARDAARPFLRAVSEGRDPASEKKHAKAERNAEANLVENVLDDFVTRYVKVNNRDSTIKESQRYIDNEILTHWKGRMVQSITRREVISLIDGIADRGAPIAANRVHALLRRFFNWAVERDIVIGSPVANVKAPGKETSRDRVLSDDEIRLVWKGCDSIGWPFGPMVKLLLITGQRREEVAGATWNEFDLAAKEPLWIIPKERAKNNKEHAVALTPSAVAILEQLPKIERKDGKPGYVLTTTGETSISGFSKAKEKLDAAMLAIARQEAMERDDDASRVSIADWRIHDLRRTCASGMAAIGQPVHIVEAVLNHKSGSIRGVAAVYNRHDYAIEKRRALLAWADYLQELVIGKSSGNVVPMRGANS
jgi:integrase